jgi:uncharacterized repeat protein (TIGR03803 family)
MRKSYLVALRLTCLLAAAASVGIASARASTYRVLYKFQGGADGFNPYANLVKVGGTLYGTTEHGGTQAFGTMFAVNAATAAHEVLHSFRGGKDGGGPYAGLIDVGGTLYGTTTQGGTDAELPVAAPIADGTTLYGTTYLGGGANNDGTVFAITP